MTRDKFSFSVSRQNFSGFLLGRQFSNGGFMDHDDLDPARGLFIALAISGAVWFAVLVLLAVLL